MQRFLKFSKFDSLDVIRQALTEQTPLPKDKVEGADLLTLLKTATQTASKTMVLLFDQFEQFFVHRKLDQEREPFVQALAGWYQRNPSLPVKILIGVRGDFLDRMHDLYGAMGYSPVTDSDCFRLDRFTPQQTAAIFRVIAENERIDLDEAFVDELAAQDLASREDGRVSAVDIQIIAWMLVAAGIQDKEARTMALSAMIRTTTRGIFNEAQAQEVWAKTIQVAEAIEPREAQIRALSAVATAFAAQPGADNELWMQALRMMDRIRDPETKARVLIDIVHFAPHTVDAGQARTLWIEVVQVAQGIGISEAKAQVLNAVLHFRGRTRNAWKPKPRFRRRFNKATVSPVVRWAG